MTAKPAPKISYGKVDCLVPTAKELCYTFFLTANFRVPEFYHIVTYIHNGTTELRQIPPMLYRNVTEASQSHQKVVKYVLGKEWKGVAPWTGFLNPITGYLRSFTHIFGLLIEYYEMCPQWAIMIGISLLGRAIT